MLHTQGIFRTPPGWNLLVTGPINAAKDGIAPLTGIIETDWAPMTFTMNWRLTRPGQWVRFDAGEAIAHLMPVQRGMIGQWEPELVPMRENPDLLDQFTRWSASRDAFHAQIVCSAVCMPKPADHTCHFEGDRCVSAQKP